MVVKITVANPSGATSATHETMAIPFLEGSYTTGTTADGVPYVVAPNGVKLTDPSPVRTATGRGARHGSQLNPVSLGSGGLGLKTAFDSYDAGVYDAALLHDFSAILSPNDAFVKTEGLDTVTEVRDGFITKWRGLHVVSSAPAATAFAAPFLWPPADKASRPWRTVDLDARLAELPSYSAAGQSVTSWASIQPYFDRFDLGRGLIQGPFNGYQSWTAYQSSPQPQSNYGQYLANVQSQVLVGLMSAGWSASDKRAALIRLLQQGCQFGEAIVKEGYTVEPDGGHELALYAPCMAWLWATGRQSEYATWRPVVSGNIFRQYYTITAGNISTDFVAHSDPLKPYPYRRRTVSNITGNNVTMTGYAPAGGLTEDTASNLQLAGLDLVKESGGASSRIVSSSQSGGVPGTVTVTLTAPVTGLVVSDTVFCRAAFTLTAGMHQWRIRDELNLCVPSPDALYLNINFPTAARMFARAIGMVGTDMAAGEGFMEMSNAGTNGYLGQVDASIIGGANPPWVRQFYDANWTTLKALPQDV